MRELSVWKDILIPWLFNRGVFMNYEENRNENVQLKRTPNLNGAHNINIEKLNKEKINNLMRSVGHTVERACADLPLADEDMMVMREEEAECGIREFVIGDTHFFDPNIILYSDRPFASVEEMNQFMIEQWNSVVNNNDTVFVLGDFFDFYYCDDIQVFDVLDQLQGNIILIAGNHDRGNLDVFRAYGIEVIEHPIIKDEFWILSHEPMFVTESAPYANIFAHVHNNPMYRTVSSRSFCASAERHNYEPMLLRDAQNAVKQYIITGGSNYD